MGRRRLTAAFAAFAAFAVAAAGCSTDEPLVVEGVWARSSPPAAEAGAVYLQVTSAEADRLVGASVDPAVAGSTRIHETRAVDGEGTGEGMGTMMMQEVGGIALPAGETVSLEPGGFHIMMMPLGAPLVAGGSFEITLMFQIAGEMTFEVEVRDDAS